MYVCMYVIVPQSRTVEIIKPIYKNKGNPTEPENCRLISHLSCFGKLFTSMLNNRLNKFAENANLIHETQCSVVSLILNKHLILYGA